MSLRHLESSTDNLAPQIHGGRSTTPRCNVGALATGTQHPHTDPSWDVSGLVPVPAPSFAICSPCPGPNFRLLWPWPPKISINIWLSNLHLLRCTRYRCKQCNRAATARRILSTQSRKYTQLTGRGERGEKYGIGLGNHDILGRVSRQSALRPVRLPFIRYTGMAYKVFLSVEELIHQHSTPCMQRQNSAIGALTSTAAHHPIAIQIASW